MARRDAVRYKGRSSLVVLMVALPVALIVGGMTFVATSQRSTLEQLPDRLGAAAAAVEFISPQAIRQGIDGGNGSYSESGDQESAAKPIPGLAANTQSPDQIAVALSDFLGGTVEPFQDGQFRWVDGTRRPTGSAVYFDPTQDYGSKAELTSGRWPRDNSEAVVTPLGIDRGLPEQGGVTIATADSERTVTIVGVAAVRARYDMPMLATTAPWGENEAYGTTYLLFRDTPVTWEEVRRLNEYGLALTSRHVVENPPDRSQLDPNVWEQDAARASEMRVAAALLGSTLFVLTGLLVGPAFAVSAGRQRRSLALAASNGAETRQLRRSVLASAVVLGVFAVIVGAVVGALVALLAAAVWTRWRPWSMVFGPPEVPWLAVAIVAVCAVLAALVAALIPALKLGRLDIVGVMKGQNVSPPISRRLPVIGAILFAIGVAGVFGAVLQESPTLGIVGVFGLIVGPLLLIPLLLVACGRLASRFTAPVRMATRDAARQRHRSAPTVAAVMAGTALLATFAVALASDTKFQAKLYAPQNLAGEGQVWADEMTRPTLDAALASAAPTWKLVPRTQLGADYDGDKEVTREPFLSLLLTGCTVTDSFPDYGDGTSPPLENGCAVAGTKGGFVNNRGGLTILPADELIRRLGLAGTDARAVRDGAVLVADASWAPGGTATIAFGEQDYSAERQGSGPPTEQPVAWSRTTAHQALTIDPKDYRRGAIDPYSGLVVTSETVQESGLSTTNGGYFVYDPAGPISADAQEKVNEKLGEELMIEVERGFQRSDKQIMLGVFGIAGFLLVTVTLISTALALAEQQADMGTLAAVGATKSTRRRFAGAQAATVALVGVTLGTLIGLVAGVAIAYPSTSSGWDEALQKEITLTPTIGIPLVPLLSILIGVPLVAGLIAAASIRRAPHVTRRGN